MSTDLLSFKPGDRVRVLFEEDDEYEVTAYPADDRVHITRTSDGTCRTVYIWRCRLL